VALVLVLKVMDLTGIPKQQQQLQSLPPQTPELEVAVVGIWPRIAKMILLGLVDLE
jgi:hypothetical protein